MKILMNFLQSLDEILELSIIKIKNLTLIVELNIGCITNNDVYQNYTYLLIV